MNVKNIGVFLSSRQNIAPVYAEAVKALGQWIGQQKLTLVYGGSKAGMMELLAATVKQHGGRVIGVVPDIVRQRGMESPHCDVTIYSADLADRKAIMMREADVFVALPGGVGTLDEMLTAAAADTIGTARQKVYALNINHFWDPLWQVFGQMQREGFLSAATMEWLQRVDTLEELEQKLQSC